MKARNTLLFVLLPLAAAGCETPTPLIESAKLSTVQLHTLDFETSKFLSEANSTADDRLKLLRDERATTLKDQREVAQTRMIALSNIKELVTLDDELRKLTEDYAERDASVAAALRSYEERLAPIKKSVTVPKEDFKQVEEALAQLGEQASATERAVFILAYVRAVAGKYKDARKAEEAEKE